MEQFKHYSVMLDECIDGLNIKENGIYVDGTAGGGGHSLEIVKHLKNGKLIAIDRDEDAINAVKARLKDYIDKVIIVRNNFSNIREVLDELQIERIDGMLLDLGVSSYQLDTDERGFSYIRNSPLDMRMDRRQTLSAKTVVNEYDEEALKKIFFEYGEERFSGRIASSIIKRRETKQLETTDELSDIIRASLPANARNEELSSIKRIFQAIRIEVNGELKAISPAIEDAVDRLNVGGRIVILTFHSLEDRIVKQTFARLAQKCTCPPELPICVCGGKAKIELVNKKPILPSASELAINSRSKSAKLRVAEKI